ncbi:MAG: tryptophan--tRNA ligase [Nitrospinota bacterium]|nr:MAG: tryptophan--tRNA ligase [Nitrospinota bacterium]
MEKARVLSGMRPTGKLHLGNYLGALKNWLSLQERYECFYFLADWHALTSEYADTGPLKSYILDIGTDWLAAGLDPERCTLFIQSRVPEHAELHLLLSMITPLAWLERVPTYKEQQQELKEKDLSTYGFLGYPLLQTADIIIYKAHYVPVGVDQVPHVELSREIVRRFHYLYGKEVFPEPAALLTEIPKVPGTDGRKMSKSYDNAIYLSDPPEAIREKIRTMVTDPQRARRHDPGDPEVCPVFAFHKIYSAVAEIDRINQECRSAEIGCVECKQILSQNLLKEMQGFMERREYYVHRPDQVREILEEGSKRARRVARETMDEVREAMQIA